MVGSSRVDVNATGGYVHFKPLMKTDADTQYNCTAANDVGFDSDVGQLRVLGICRPTVAAEI